MSNILLLTEGSVDEQDIFSECTSQHFVDTLLFFGPYISL